VVTLGRNLRRKANLPSNKKVRFILKPSRDLPPNDVEVIRTLLNAESFELAADYQPSKGTLTTHSPLGELYLPLEGLIDVNAEKARLQKELGKIAADVGRVEAKLNNPGFAAKAPPPVIEENRRLLDELKLKQAHAQKALDTLVGV
jgi:valyl-tRNA synthetase